MNQPVPASAAETAARQIRLGIGLVLFALFMMSWQDGATKILVRQLPAAQVVMVRYWAFAVFALVYVSRHGGVVRALRSQRPALQVFRSLLMVGEMTIFAFAVRWLGLAEMHALFATAPLIGTALAVPVLGERVGWRRWTGVAIGFLGALVIIRPGLAVFQPAGVIALVAATAWALYGLTTRLASFRDSFETSMIYMALVGLVASTAVGLPLWTAPDAQGWALLGLVSATGILGHLMLVKAYSFAPASALQPFNYSLLIYAVLVGVVLFGDLPDRWTILGAAMIAGSGSYVYWRERRLKRGK